MNKFFRILLLSGVAISSAYGADNSADWSALKSEVTELFTTQNVPGMSAAVVSQGKIVWKYEAGFADESRAIPVTIDTPFWIASITKPFVGLAYLHLASAGKVNLDELASSTPDFSDTCHWLKGTSIPFAKGMKCDAGITIDHILHHQINGTPGSEFMYNPIMYSRLSRHLEYTLAGTIKGMKGYHNQLAQAIDKYVLAPAGMNDTMASMFDPSKANVYQRMSDGFTVSDDGNKTKLAQPSKYIAGGAGMVSTIRDLAKFENALYTKSILPASVDQEFNEQPAFSDGSDAPYGYGWYFQTIKGHTVMWHSGWDPDNGFSGVIVRIPEKALAFVALANSEAIWWHNSLVKGEIEKSPIAKAFIFEALAR